MRAISTVLLACVALGEVAQCENQWKAIAGAAGELLSTERTVYGDMFAFSGHWLNDMGRFHQCQKIERARYVVFEVARRPWVAFAFCGPIECTKEDYYSLLHSKTVPQLASVASFLDPVAAIRPHLSVSPLATIRVHFPSEYIDDHSTIRGGAVAMLVVICLLLVVCLVATGVDLQQRRYDALSQSKKLADESTNASEFIQRRRTLPLLHCFSLYTNFLKFTQPVVSRSGENFSVLNGVRVLSIFWVILGHICAYRVGSSPLINLLDLPSIIDKPKFAFVYGAFYAVDTFFWLGGFLVSYMMVKELKTKGRINWFMVYFHRFWRLVPLFMFVTFFVWAFQGYGGEGPMWFKADDSSEDCASYWWTNLLFLNNFLPDGKRSYCIVVGWYMANDMQFYLISPPILYVYAKFQRGYGWLAVVLLCLISVVTSWEIAARYDLNMVLIAPNNSDYMMYVYVKPYCRVAPYALGLACGFIVHEINQFEKTGRRWDAIGNVLGRAFRHPIASWMAFALGVFLITLITFVQYDVWKHGNLAFDSWSQSQNSAFIAWNHLVYGCGISFLLLPMLLGNIQPVCWLLSLSIWTPLAKLTFSVYLIHLTIIDRLCLGGQSAYYMGDLQVFMDLLMFVCLCYFVAFFISIAIESPMVAMEKVLFHQDSTSRRLQQAEEKKTEE